MAKITINGTDYTLSPLFAGEIRRGSWAAYEEAIKVPETLNPAMMVGLWEDVLLASLKVKHPEITVEDLALTFIQLRDAFQVVSKLTFTGQDPEAEAPVQNG